MALRNIHQAICEGCGTTVVMPRQSHPKTWHRIYVGPEEGEHGYKWFCHRSCVSFFLNPDSAPAAYPHGLTPCEVKALRLVAQDLTNAQIAHRLGLVQSTIKNRLTEVYTKLHVQSRHGAVMAGFRLGLIQPTDLIYAEEEVGPLRQVA